MTPSLLDCPHVHEGPLEHPDNLIVVLTGPPSYGKTWLLEKRFQRDGFVCIPEVARQIMDENIIIDGVQLHPKHDLLGFNEENYRRQKAAYEAAQGIPLAIYDRFFYDAEAYLHKHELPRYLRKLPNQLCQVALVMDKLEYEDDGTRYEGAGFSEYIHDYFYAAYARRRVPTFKVPTFSKNVEENLDKRYEHCLKIIKALYPQANLTPNK